jgi:hypothetical protein
MDDFSKNISLEKLYKVRRNRPLLSLYLKREKRAGPSRGLASYPDCSPNVFKRIVLVISDPSNNLLIVNSLKEKK